MKSIRNAVISLLVASAATGLYKYMNFKRKRMSRNFMYKFRKGSKALFGAVSDLTKAKKHASRRFAGVFK